MVFDNITQDWVPRYGMGSIKKIQEAHNWLQPEKPKHVQAGMNPFDYQKNEKKITKEKQDLRELKNKITASGPSKEAKSRDQILDNSAKNNSGESTAAEGAND